MSKNTRCQKKKKKKDKSRSFPGLRMYSSVQSNRLTLKHRTYSPAASVRRPSGCGPSQDGVAQPTDFSGNTAFLWEFLHRFQSAETSYKLTANSHATTGWKCYCRRPIQTLKYNIRGVTVPLPPPPPPSSPPPAPGNKQFGSVFSKKASGQKEVNALPGPGSDKWLCRKQVPSL